MHVKIIPFLLLIGFLAFVGCATNNVEEIFDPCDDSSISYSADIQPLLVNNCAVPGCHAGASPERGIDLSTYADTKMVADSGWLVARINPPGNPMPPGGFLPECLRNQIQSWVNDGALEN